MCVRSFPPRKSAAVDLDRARARARHARTVQYYAGTLRRRRHQSAGRRKLNGGRSSAGRSALPTKSPRQMRRLFARAPELDCKKAAADVRHRPAAAQSRRVRRRGGARPTSRRRQKRLVSVAAALQDACAPAPAHKRRRNGEQSKAAAAAAAIVEWLRLAYANDGRRRPASSSAARRPPPPEATAEVAGDARADRRPSPTCASYAPDLHAPDGRPGAAPGVAWRRLSQAAAVQPAPAAPIERKWSKGETGARLAARFDSGRCNWWQSRAAAAAAGGGAGL